MSSFEQSTEALGPFVKISRTSFFLVIGLLFFLAIGAITFFLSIDAELFFGADRLALKVGGTVLTIPQLHLLKSLAGVSAEPLSEKEFAGKLFDTILLAEAGRRLKLDRNEQYRLKVQVFDKALPPASDPQDLSRALFLIDELAGMTREYLLQQISATQPEPASASSTISTAAITEKFHLRTILVKEAAIASQVMNEAAAGAPFGQLNASWSVSPYAGVNGDLGFVGKDDLPEGLFDRLEQLPVGSLSVGFADVSGVHLFRIESRKKRDEGLLKRAAANQSISGRQQEEVKRLLHQQQILIPSWINPNLHPIISSQTVQPGTK